MPIAQNAQAEVQEVESVAPTDSADPFPAEESLDTVNSGDVIPSENVLTAEYQVPEKVTVDPIYVAEAVDTVPESIFVGPVVAVDSVGSSEALNGSHNIIESAAFQPIDTLVDTVDDDGESVESDDTLETVAEDQNSDDESEINLDDESGDEPIEVVAFTGTRAIGIVNTTIDAINQLLGQSVDIIVNEMEEVREMMVPLSAQMYAPVLFMDLDHVINTLSALTNEVEHGFQFIFDDFNTRMNSVFDEAFSRVDCQTDVLQYRETVNGCKTTVETNLGDLEESAATSMAAIARNAETLNNLVADCRTKHSRILMAKCAVMSVRKVVNASEMIRNNLEEVAQSLSANIQELPVNFEACAPACQ